jgi:hypothetical protein
MKQAALLAIVIAVAFVPAASAGAKTATTVTLDDVFAVPIETHWDGDVKSSRKACKKDRLVIVYRVRSGDDQKMGATRSYRGMVDPGYYWSLVKDGIAPTGNYYAKVRPTDTCAGDRSGTLHFSGPV